MRDEVRKTLTFWPERREYFIIATAPDDVTLQELARELAVEQKSKGRSILIYVWGWNTLEERISVDAVAREQFDPDYGAPLPVGGDRRSLLKPHRTWLLELRRKENDLTLDAIACSARTGQGRQVEAVALLFRRGDQRKKNRARQRAGSPRRR